MYMMGKKRINPNPSLPSSEMSTIQMEIENIKTGERWYFKGWDYHCTKYSENFTGGNPFPDSSLLFGKELSSNIDLVPSF